MNRYIDIGEEFSRTPGSRFRKHSMHSGEEFRDDILIPFLQSHAGAVVVVDLDKPFALSGSFLEEVFGGLVRKLGPDVVHQVRIRAVDKPERAVEARDFMYQAIDNY